MYEIKKSFKIILVLFVVNFLLYLNKKQNKSNIFPGGRRSPRRGVYQITFCVCHFKRGWLIGGGICCCCSVDRRLHWPSSSSSSSSNTTTTERCMLISTWKPLLALCPPSGHVRCLKHYYVCDARARLGNVACGASLDTNTHTYADALESLGRWANSRCRAAAAAASVVRWCRTRRERGPGCLRCSGSEPPTEPSERPPRTLGFLFSLRVYRFSFFFFGLLLEYQ